MNAWFHALTRVYPGASISIMARKAEATKHVPKKPPMADEEKSIVQLMEESRRRRFRDAVMKWRGKIHLEIDIDELRGRHRQ